MKIVIDENVAFAEEAFGAFGEVVMMNGREISNSHLINADALIVRSITKVNEELLKNCGVKFVGAATIGVDHIDAEYLKRNKIFFSNAKGCNAHAVAEYVLTAVSSFAYNNGLDFSQLTAGIIGYGEIGSKADNFFRALGIKTLANDPPLQEDNFEKDFSDLNEVMNCDIVTLHVPFTSSGKHPTKHLINERNINSLKSASLFINTSRGEVVDSKALLSSVEKNNIRAVIDVWENEPEISAELLEKVLFATPHIAGYSLEGKINGTKMIYDSFCRFFNLENRWSENSLGEKIPLAARLNDSLENFLYGITSRIYDIAEDDKKLKSSVNFLPEERGKFFDGMRKNYKLRREFDKYKILISPANAEFENILRRLRFSV